MRDFYIACKDRGGHRDIVDLMIQNGATSWNWGLQVACECNHRDIIDLMIQKGATDWDLGLRGACIGGHHNIIDLMIKKGATDWDAGLYGACQGGHRDIVDLMIQNGATKLNGGLLCACIGCYGGHCEIIDLMIQKGATKTDYIISFYKDGSLTLYCHFFLRMNKQQRQRFSKKLNNHKHTFLKTYMQNRHIIATQKANNKCTIRNYKHTFLKTHMRNRNIIATQKANDNNKCTLLNILRNFVCNDVATWSCRFVGFYK